MCKTLVVSDMYENDTINRFKKNYPMSYKKIENN